MKPSGPELLFLGNFKIIDSVSLLAIDLFIFSVSILVQSGEIVHF